MSYEAAEGLKQFALNQVCLMLHLRPNVCKRVTHPLNLMGYNCIWTDTRVIRFRPLLLHNVLIKPTELCIAGQASQLHIWPVLSPS